MWGVEREIVVPMQYGKSEILLECASCKSQEGFSRNYFVAVL